MMRRITPIEVMGYVFKIVVVAFVIIFLLQIFVNMWPVVRLNQAEKFSIELVENVMNSNLTTSYGVFYPVLVESYHMKIIEPFMRQCDYAYALRFTCKDRDSCDDENIMDYIVIGYFTDKAPLFSKTYPIGYRIDGSDDYYNNVIPVELQVDVYDTALTNIACAIEKAYKLGEPQELRCLGYEGRDCRTIYSYFTGVGTDETDTNKNICSLQVTSPGNYKCSSEKRYLPDVVFQRAEPLVEFETLKNAKILRAIPTQGEFSGVECPNNWQSLVSSAPTSVALCIE